VRRFSRSKDTELSSKDGSSNEIPYKADFIATVVMMNYHQTAYAKKCIINNHPLTLINGHKLEEF
jgi:hypothetical protein